MMLKIVTNKKTTQYKTNIGMMFVDVCYRERRWKRVSNSYLNIGASRFIKRTLVKNEYTNVDIYPNTIDSIENVSPSKCSGNQIWPNRHLKFSF